MAVGPYLAIALTQPPAESLRVLLETLARWSAPAVYDTAIRSGFAAAVIDDVRLLGIVPEDVRYALWVDDSDASVDDASAAPANQPIHTVLPSRRDPARP